MADQITAQHPLPDACNVKQNPVSQKHLAGFGTTGCGSDRFKSGWLRNNLNSVSWVSCSSLLLWKKPSTRSWSLCLSCEGFHGCAPSDSRRGWTQTSVHSDLFRGCQGQPRLRTSINSDHWFSHPAALCTTREMTKDSWVPLPEVLI